MGRGLAGGGGAHGWGDRTTQGTTSIRRRGEVQDAPECAQHFHSLILVLRDRKTSGPLFLTCTATATAATAPLS